MAQSSIALCLKIAHLILFYLGLIKGQAIEGYRHPQVGASGSSPPGMTPRLCTWCLYVVSVDKPDDECIFVALSRVRRCYSEQRSEVGIVGRGKLEDQSDSWLLSHWLHVNDDIHRTHHFKISKVMNSRNWTFLLFLISMSCYFLKCCFFVFSPSSMTSTIRGGKCTSYL